jgi:hypothetical protein
MEKQKQMKRQLFCAGAVIALSSEIGSAQLPDHDTEDLDAKKMQIIPAEFPRWIEHEKLN